MFAKTTYKTSDLQILCFINQSMGGFGAGGAYVGQAELILPFSVPMTFF
jgi:hypothetical protein